MSFGLPYMPGAIWTPTSAYPWTYDFESGVTGWTQYGSPSPANSFTQSNTVARGTYSGKFVPGGSSSYQMQYILLPESASRSSVITLDFWSYAVTNTNGWYFGIFNSSYQGYWIGQEGSQTAGAYEWSSFGAVSATHWSAGSIFTGLNAWHKCRIVLNGTQTIFYVYGSDGTTLRGSDTNTESTYSTFDRLAIYSWSGNVTYFDDISITLG